MKTTPFEMVFIIHGNMTDKIQVNLRLPKEVIMQLKEEAAKQKRSVNNLLEVIVDEYLQKQNNK